MDGYTIIILLTLFGFLALAAMLLVPVYRFLRREEKASREWTPEEMRAGQTQRWSSSEEPPSSSEAIATPGAISTPEDDLRRDTD